MDRRSFLRNSCFATASAAVSPVSLFAQRAAGAPSLSRQFARWVSALRYEDLPPAVIDRAKGLTLQALASALVGSQLPAGQEAVNLVNEEEAGVRNGAMIMVQGAKVTKAG